MVVHNVNDALEMGDARWAAWRPSKEKGSNSVRHFFRERVDGLHASSRILHSSKSFS